MSSYRDAYGRSLEYLRVSVTDRCNFRCPYCRPETGEIYDPPADHLNAAEIARVVGISQQLGVRAVRFTGGEPLLRRDLPEVITAEYVITCTKGTDDGGCPGTARGQSPSVARFL